MTNETSALDNPVWSNREPVRPEHYGHNRTRSPEALDKYLQQLRENNDRWAVFSVHRTRGAARMRVHQLRRSKSYGDKPLRWRTLRVDEGNSDSPVQVLVRWDEDNPDNVRIKALADMYSTNVED